MSRAAGLAGSRRRVVVGAAVVASGAALVWLRGAAPVVEVPAGAPGPRVVRCTPGVTLAYRLALGSHDRMTLGAGRAAGGAEAPPPEAFGARTRLDGRLEVGCEAYADGVATLSVRLPQLDTASVVVREQEALTEAAREALRAAVAVVRVGEDGEVRSVACSEGTPPLAENLLMLVVTETAVRLGAGAEWVAEEVTLQGTARSLYRVERDGEALELVRTRGQYASLVAESAAGRALSQRIEGTARLTFVEGALRSLDARESLRVGSLDEGRVVEHDGSVRLEWLGRERGGLATRAAVARAVGPERAPGTLAVSETLEERLREQRVDGLTGPALLDTVTRFGNAGKVPDHNRFLWRATALLRQHPELCAELVKRYEAAELEAPGRALVLDLLVGAGTPAAQAALRDALTRPRGQDEAGYSVHFQRLGLLANPDAETLVFAREHARAPGAEGRSAALASYGAVVGRRVRADDAAARDDVAALLGGLHAAEAPDDQAAHLRAVSNLRLPSVESDLQSLAASEHHRVRRAVARALQNQPSDTARATLVGLAADRDGEVQRQSLMALAGRTLTGDELGALARVVSERGLRETGYDALLDLVEPDPARAEARQVLEAVLRADPQNLQVLARARELLSASQRLAARGD